MDNETFIDKCDKIWYRKDWAYYCHDCSLQDLIVICCECFDKSKHFGHEFETIYCDEGVWCDCGDQNSMKSDGFCSKHSVANIKRFDDNKRKNSLRSSSNSYSRTRLMSEQKSKESDGFLEGILHNLFSKRPRDLPEFYSLTKISKNSSEGTLIMKYFERSRANNLEIKIKKIYEINKLNTKFSNPHFENSRRMLLWYTFNDNESLSKILTNGIKYENGKMGRGLYFRDRINRFSKYEDNDFGLLLLCDVAVGSMYRISEKKQLREIPYGFDSLKGVGRYTPEKGKFKNFGNDISVPIGKTVTNESVNKTEFDINQFIVFDKNQVIIRYLIQYHIHK